MPPLGGRRAAPLTALINRLSSFLSRRVPARFPPLHSCFGLCVLIALSFLTVPSLLLPRHHPRSLRHAALRPSPRSTSLAPSTCSSASHLRTPLTTSQSGPSLEPLLRRRRVLAGAGAGAGARHLGGLWGSAERAAVGHTRTDPRVCLAPAPSSLSLHSQSESDSVRYRSSDSRTLSFIY